MNVHCIKWRRTRITCGVIGTIWQQVVTLRSIHKNKIKGGGRGYFMGGCMLVWVYVSVSGEVCGVTLRVWGGGVDGGGCGVTLCVCLDGGWMEGCVV